MDVFFSALERFFSSKIFGDIQLYNLLATVFKYIFVVIVFIIYNIIRMIYRTFKELKAWGTSTIHI